MSRVCLRRSVAPIDQSVLEENRALIRAIDRRKLLRGGLQSRRSHHAHRLRCDAPRLRPACPQDGVAVERSRPGA